MYGLKIDMQELSNTIESTNPHPSPSHYPSCVVCRAQGVHELLEAGWLGE